MRSLAEIPALNDPYSQAELTAALRGQIDFLRRSKRISSLRFGREVYAREDYLLGLEGLAKVLELKPDNRGLRDFLQIHFDAYQVYGREDWGQIFMTAYFEPVIAGRSKREPPYTTPLYRTPPDLVEVKLAGFPGYNANMPAQLRGRLAASPGSRAQIVPFYSRAEIELDQRLAGRGLEICWVDPVDAFFTQIQGSATVVFANGKEERVGYAAQNGHAYEALGKFLRNVIPIEEMTMQRIESHLRGLPHQEREVLKSLNPSYVFFQSLNANALTYLGVPAVARRTIATDAKFFPKGALALLRFPEPKLDEAGVVVGEEERALLVLDQDVGGAIRGPDRVDYFWGRGEEAKRYAGLIKTKGNLTYLAPKRAWLEQLKLKGKSP